MSISPDDILLANTLNRKDEDEYTILSDTPSGQEDEYTILEQTEGPEYFGEYISGSTQGVIGQFQKGRAVVSESVAEALEYMGSQEKALGWEERAKVFRERAKLNDKQAEEAAFVSMYGEEGLVQFRNMSDSKWWRATMAQMIPGSAPFLAGAGAGGTAGFFIGGPLGALIGAALGGGATVYAQSYGDAYYEYLEKFPDDEKAAEDYAFKVSGLTAIINALSVPAAALGVGTTALKQFMIQAVIQGGIGGVDTVTGNKLKQEIDPDLDITTGLAPGIAGEVLFEAPVLVAGTRRVLPKYSEEVEQGMQEARDKNEELVELKTNKRIEEFSIDERNIDELTSQELLDLIEEKKLNVGRVAPLEGRNSVVKKIKEAIRSEEENAVVRSYMIDRMMSENHPEKVYADQKALLDKMTDEEIDAHIMQEFGSIEAYERWIPRQGQFAFEIDGMFATRNRELDKAALAQAGADLITRSRKEGPIWLLGQNEFNDYVKDIEQTFTLDELRLTVKEHVPGLGGRQTEGMTKAQLAFALAETKAVLELQRQKLKASWKEESPLRKFAREKFTSRKAPVRRYRNWRTIPEEQASAKEPFIQDAIKVEGNAIRAEMIIDSADGNEVTLGFSRRGIEEGLSFAEQMALRGAELSVSRVNDAPVKEGDEYFGKTIGEIIATEKRKDKEVAITQLELPTNTSPQLQSGFVNKLLGVFNEYARPLMPVGSLMGSRQKQYRSRLKAMDSKAQRMGFAIERAIAEAIRKGEIKTKEEADKLFMAYLRQTGARIPLTPEERVATERRIIDAQIEKFAAKDEQYEVDRLEDEIQRLTIQLEGVQDSAVALRQLPESLRTVASETRTGVDALSERLLNEIPEEMFDVSQREMIQDNLNRYLTRSFAIFEPALGWNPKYAMTSNLLEKWKEKKPFTELYNKALISVKSTDRNKFPDHLDEARRLLGATATEEQINTRAEEIADQAARDVLDLWLEEEMYSNSYDIASLAGVLAPPKEKGAEVQRAAKLLTKRGYIPYAIRELLGEIKAPELVAATSFARIAKVIETANFYAELKRLNDMPGEAWFSPVKTSQFSIAIETGDPFNPLEGYYTTKQMRDLLVVNAPLHGSNNILAAWTNTFGVAKAVTQYGMIVLSPGTQMRNLYGAAVMFGFNGNFRGLFGDFQETTEVVMNDLFKNYKYDVETGKVTGDLKALDAAWDYLQQLGIVNTEVRANDALGVFTRMRSGEPMSLNQAVNKLYALGQTGPGKAFDDYILVLNRGAKRAYGASDDFFKILAFYSERTKLREMIDSVGGSDDLKLRVLREFAGTLKTKSGPTEGTSDYIQDQETVLRNVTDLDKYIDNVAAYMVRNTMPNYDYIGKFAEYLQLLPFGNFTAFPTEIARTSANAAQMTWRLGSYSPSGKVLEQATAEGVEIPQLPFKQRASERAIGGYMGGHGLVASLGALSKMIFNVDDEDEFAAAEISPEWAQDRKIWMSGIRSPEEDGGAEYIDPNYVFPYESLGRLYFVLLRTLREEDAKGGTRPQAVTKGLVQFAIDYLQAYTQQTIAYDVATSLATNENKINPLNTRQIYNPDDDWDDQIADMISYGLREAGPGVYKQVGDVYFSLQEGDAALDRYGDKMEFLDAAMKVAGFSNSDLNPSQSMRFLVSQYIKEENFYTSANLSKEAFSKEEITKEDVIKDWEDAQRSWFRIQQDLYFSLQALKQLNVNEEVYEEQLNRFIDGTGADWRLATNIENGVFTPWETPSYVTRNFEAAQEEFELKREWPEERIEIKMDYMKDNFISLTANPRLNRDIYSNQLKPEPESGWKD